ncbi:8334_t:CDS:2, partial [Gigaspora rosea]
HSHPKGLFTHFACSLASFSSAFFDATPNRSSSTLAILPMTEKESLNANLIQTTQNGKKDPHQDKEEKKDALKDPAIKENECYLLKIEWKELYNQHT